MDENTVFRIIVIDDNPAIQRDFIKILTNPKTSALEDITKKMFGGKSDPIALPTLQIDIASQGQEGVELIQKSIESKKPYSLAFVDIRMPPGWDGIETIKRIWAIDKDIQVVICTAYSDYTWEETVEELGKTDNLLILKKPFDNTSVRQFASALTKKWALLKETRLFTASLKDELEHQATHDPLTGLANRIALLDRFQEAIKHAQSDNSLIAVMFIDLDRFKLINDSLSHAAGDELLCETAARLKTGMRYDDTLARFGGDEFIIILPKIRSRKDIIDKAGHLINLFQPNFNLFDRSVKIGASIGISIYPTDGKTPDVLLHHADNAMYHAKELGGNQFQLYSQEMNEQSIEKLDKEIQLREAVEKNEFFLCYQPQFDLTNEKLIAVEALLRWQHPTKGILLPIDFIPLAEEAGLMIPIGEWVLRTACQQNKKWQEAGYPPIRMAVNMTEQQLKQKNIVSTIKNILDESGLKPDDLEVELTENVVISNLNVMETVIQLKELGVAIAIDDFGTGYSSISYLKNLPLDRLKIDGSFIRNIKSPLDDEVIIRAIIAVANNLNLEVLAEGVETNDQINFLKKLQCNKIQGYYYSQPLTNVQLEEMMKHPKQKENILNE